MKNIKFPVILTTSLLLIYTVMPQFNGPEEVIMGLFIVLPFFMIWMVVRVLKDGEPSQYKWDEGVMYDDMPMDRSE